MHGVSTCRSKCRNRCSPPSAVGKPNRREAVGGSTPGGFSVANPAGSTAPLVTSLALWCLWQPQSQIIAPQFNSTSLRRQLHQVSSLLKHGRATYSSCYSCQGRAGAKNASAAGRQPAVQPIGLHATVCKDQSGTSVGFLTHPTISVNRHLILTLLPGGQEHTLQVTIFWPRTRIYPSIFIYFPIGPFTVALEHSQGRHCVSLWRGNSVTTVMKMSLVQVGVSCIQKQISVRDSWLHICIPVRPKAVSPHGIHGTHFILIRVSD